MWARNRRGSALRQRRGGAHLRRGTPSGGTRSRHRPATAAFPPAAGVGPCRRAAKSRSRRPPDWRAIPLPRVVSLAQPQIRALVSRVPMSSENLAGRTIAGYRLLERVGEGGTAEVYRAEHPERGPCAFKVLRQRLRGDPTAVKRFLREAGYGSRVRHPGVVRTYDFGEADGLYYLALEWAKGEPLADYPHRNGRLAPAEAVALARQLADALAAAHQAGIIHRDLKPENIMYDPAAGTVKLLDFGIARDAEEPPEERLTRTGFFVGTLQYVAPEALSGELVDGRADIYSLAKITYYMLTGRHPHDGRSPRELFQQLLNGKPTPLSEASDRKFPPALEAAVMKGLARQPGDRQPTVTACADDLEAALAGTKGSAKSRGLLGALKNIVGKRNSE